MTDDIAPEMVAHAEELGFSLDPDGPVDSVWPEPWALLQSWRGTTECPAPSPDVAPGECEEALTWIRSYALVHPQLRPNTAQPEQDFFLGRWSQVPPGGEVFGDRSRGGPWHGLFTSNITKPGVTIVNTFNSTDHVLRIDEGRLGDVLPHAWYWVQWAAKPYALPLVPAEAHDFFGTRWALLLGTSTERVIGELSTRLSLDNDEAPRQIRQWAEIAFWFPAVSSPAGASEVPGITNIDMVGIGGVSGPGLDGTPSHSYLWSEAYPQVWSGYIQIRDQFE